jgi:hypothetical protein
MPHATTLPSDSTDANRRQKVLANRGSEGNSIKISSTVPRKPKKAAKEDNASTVAAASAEPTAPASTKRRPAKAKKNGTASAKKPAPKKEGKAQKKSEPASSRPPTDEEVQLRAYFIAERRHRLNLPGDASSDWLEARRQLLSEDGVK